MQNLTENFIIRKTITTAFLYIVQNIGNTIVDVLGRIAVAYCKEFIFRCTLFQKRLYCPLEMFCPFHFILFLKFIMSKVVAITLAALKILCENRLATILFRIDISVLVFIITTFFLCGEWVERLTCFVGFAKERRFAGANFLAKYYPKVWRLWYKKFVQTRKTRFYLCARNKLVACINLFYFSAWREWWLPETGKRNWNRC